MQIVIYIAIFLISAVIFTAVGVQIRKKISESKLGSAETEARRIIEEAQKEAEDIVKEAENRIIAMVDENEITRKAYEQKNEIIQTANEMAREISNGTKEHADAILEKIEVVLLDTLKTIQNNRKELQ